MTRSEGKPAVAAVKEVLGQNPDILRELIREVVQDFLEAEMDEVIGASKGERTSERLGYRSGYYGRTLVASTQPDQVFPISRFQKTASVLSRSIR